MRNKLLFNEKMIAQEDTLFYYEFSQNTDVVIRYNQPCYIYRQRLTSVMHSKSDERSVKYYRSMQEMYDVYATYLKSGNYKNEELLCKKIHHMKQNLAFMLALISDTGFVKSELKALKSNKLYPYKLRIQALKGKEPFLRRVMTFCLPIEPVFWVLHQLYKKHIK